jgi:ribosome-associated toxin RatA of RatAB toxin-antitoxin module
MSTPSPAPAPRPRRRRWVFVPLTLLLLLLIAFTWAYVRGTSAETEVRNPATASDPPVSQLHRTPDGYVAVRAAVILPQPRQKVWEVVTDFAHYGDFLPYVKDVTAERQPDGVTVVSGQAKSAFSGYWAFTLAAHEEKKEDWRVWWKEKGEGEVRLNHGGWTLQDAGADQTLLILELDAEVKSTPTWVLRNFFLYRLRQVLAAVKMQLEAKTE